MDKLREGEPSITVDGEPLADHLEREEGKEKTDHTEEARKEEIVTKSKHKKKIRPRERFEDDPARVSRRVRHLSPFEIRKEYGVKDKPFPTLNQNVLFVLFNAGDALINSKAISDEIGKPLADVSSALSHIWNKLKNEGMIYRKRVGLAYQYCMTNDALAFGFDPFFRKYWDVKPKVRGDSTAPGERTGPYAEIELPYKRTSKNVLHLMAQTHAEIFTARELAEGVGKPPANISSTLQLALKRLLPHNMISLFGTRARRTYQLHQALAGMKGEDLIEYVQSHKKHWDQGHDVAWAYWDFRLASKPGLEPAEPVTPDLAALPDPAEKTLVTAAQVTELVAPLLQRIIAVEQDGLEDIVHNIDKKLHSMAGAFEGFKKGVKDDIKDIFDLENKPAGQFDLNVNIRFLLR